MCVCQIWATKKVVDLVQELQGKIALLLFVEAMQSNHSRNRRGKYRNNKNPSPNRRNSVHRSPPSFNNYGLQKVTQKKAKVPYQAEISA